MEHTTLSRTDASAAVTGLGWRYVLGEFRTEVQTGSLPLAADVAGRAAAAPGAEGHLRMDVRADRVVFSLQTAALAWVTTRDVELARQISAVAQEFRLTTRPGRVQVIEIGIDAMDIPRIRPFWKAVLGYADEPGRGGTLQPQDGLIDPLGQGRSGSSRWTHRGRSATGSTSMSRCRTTRRTSASRIRSRPAAPSCPMRRRPRSGCWPTRKATRPASPPGRAGTYGLGSCWTSDQRAR